MNPDQPHDQWPVGVEVLEELGRGATSIVYRVAKDGAEYALKVLEASDDPAEVLAAFRREAALMATVRHPGLARIHDVGLIAGRPYLVLDLVPGRPLGDLLAEHPLGPDAALSLAADVTGVLVAVHRRGLVHRDIKPHNIIIDPQGVAHLIDFGLAARERPGRDERAVGTLAYAAPEQAGTLRRTVDGRSDLYSLGVVIFESLAGRLPFRSDDVGELLRMHAVSAAPDLTTLVPGVPAELARCVARLLAKDPDDRYPSASALLTDLLALAPELERGLPASVTTMPGVHDGFLHDHADQRSDGRSDNRSDDRSEGRSGVDEPLSGRDAELAELSSRWQSALRGHGGAALIIGAAGGGKKRLARELTGAVRAGTRVAGPVVLHAGCARDDQAPMTAIRSAVEAYARWVFRLPVAEGAPLITRLRTAAGSMSALLAGLSGTLGGLLGGTASLPDEDRQQQFQQAVASFLAELSTVSGGLLLVLDDVEWLDPGSLKVLELLTDRLGSLPLLVLATAQPGAEHSDRVTRFESALGGMAPRLELQPLDVAGVRELLSAVLPGAGTTTALARLVAVRSDGNAFVALEYLRAIIDAGLLSPTWGTWVLDEEGLDALALPQDALGLVLKRVEGLGAQAQRVLTAAAAVGGVFRPGLVARVCDVGEDVVLDVVAEAATRRLVEHRGTGRVAFVHDQIRECLLQPVPAGTRAGLHARIAATLETDPDPDGGGEYELARHHLASGRLAPPTQLFYACVAAGRRALSEHDPALAVEFFELAVGSGRPLDTASRHAAAVALARSGRFLEAVTQLETVLQAETRPIARASLFAELAEVHRATWSFDAARDAVHSGLAELGAAMPAHPLPRVLLASWWGLVGALIGLTRIGVGMARGQHREKLRLITVLHQTGAYVGSLSGDNGEMLIHNLFALTTRNLLGRGAEYVRSTGGGAFLLAVLGLRRPARLALRRARQAAAATDDPRVVAQAAWYAGGSAFIGGWDGGERWRAVLLQHGQWIDVAQYADAVTAPCWDLAMQGRTAEVQEWLDRGARMIKTRGRDDVAGLLSIQAVLRSMQGRPGEASQYLARARQSTAGQGAAGFRASLGLAELHAHLEQAEFGEPFEECARFFGRLRLDRKPVVRPLRLALVPLAMGRLAQCRLADPDPDPELDPDRAVERTEGAVERAERAVAAVIRVAGTPLERAYGCVLSADLLVLKGRPEQALRLLGRLIPLSPDAPLVEYEALRVRARALGALARSAAALREAGRAHALAVAQGWPHRARWISTEFGRAAVAQSGGSGGLVSRQLPSAPLRAGIERERLRALEAVSQAAARLLHPDEVARVALDETIRILAAERAFLFLTERDGEVLVPRLGRDGSGSDLTQLAGYSASLVERVRVTGEPLVVTGTEEGAALGARSVVLHGLRSIMIAPLKLDGRLLGVVYLDSQVAKGIFTEEDAGILSALTTHVATSLETARAAQLEISVQTARRERELAESMRTAITEMSATLVPDEVLTRLLVAAARVLPVQDAWLVLRRDRDLIALSGTSKAEPSVLGPAPEGPLMIAGVPVVGSNAELPPGGVAALVAGAASWLCVPLLGSDGELGVLLLTAGFADVYGESEVQLAAMLAAQAMTAYERAQLFAQVQELAIADDLTGIPNRRHFFELAGRDVASAQRHGHPLAALMIDIDHFKRVNDAHGHATGDEVIREVAQRLAAQLRGTDVVGRYGGEEFAVILSQTQADDLASTAERLRRAVGQVPVSTGSGPLHVTVSVGAAELSGSDVDAAAMLARADRALYQAKREGRDRVCVDSDPSVTGTDPAILAPTGNGLGHDGWPPET